MSGWPPDPVHEPCISDCSPCIFAASIGADCIGCQGDRTRILTFGGIAPGEDNDTFRLRMMRRDEDQRHRQELDTLARQERQIRAHLWEKAKEERRQQPTPGDDAPRLIELLRLRLGLIPSGGGTVLDFYDLQLKDMHHHASNALKAQEKP